jgi:hypothetical protein
MEHKESGLSGIELEYKECGFSGIEMKHKESGVWSDGEGDRTTSKLIG